MLVILLMIMGLGLEKKNVFLVLPHIASIISSSFPPSNPQLGTLVWCITTDGEYSVKSSSMAHGIHNPNFEKVEIPWLWKLHVPPVIKFLFLGKLIKLVMMGFYKR